MKHTNVQKLTLAGLFCAIAVVGSMFSFPMFGSKCAPIQHMINVLCAVQPDGFPRQHGGGAALRPGLP